MLSSTSKTFKIEETKTCLYDIEFKTPLACAGGLSASWIFIIVFCSVLIVYISAGCFYMYKKNGNEFNMQAFPNLEFWKDLPSLVTEGFHYFVNIVKQLDNKNSDQSTVEYEDI